VLETNELCCTLKSSILYIPTENNVLSKKIKRHYVMAFGYIIEGNAEALLDLQHRSNLNKVMLLKLFIPW
jgi:hypothetical protein